MTDKVLRADSGKISWLYHDSGLSISDIARELDLPRSTIDGALRSRKVGTVSLELADKLTRLAEERMGE